MPPPRLKRSNTASAVPASLEDGEIAINQADGKLYYHTAANGVASFSALPTADSTMTGVLTVQPTSPPAVPGGSIQIIGDNQPAVLSTFRYATSNGMHGFHLNRMRGTQAAPEILQANDSLGGVVWNSITTAGSRAQAGYVVSVCKQTPAVGETVLRSELQFGVGDGTSQPVVFTVSPTVSNFTNSLTVGGTAVVVSSDSRLTDARTPTAHKATHATGGSDALTPADIGAVSVGGVVVASAGAVNAPSYTFTGDSNTGIYSPGADQLNIVTGGISRITVSAAGLVATAGDISCLGTLRAGVGVQTSGGRALFRAVNEPYAVGSAYSLTSGFVYFGAANESATPDAVICNASGAGLMTLQYGGNVGIGTTLPAISSGTGLHCAGSTMRLGASRTPASSTATGNTGEICWDSSYLYVCVNTNTWRRIPHSTW